MVVLLTKLVLINSTQIRELFGTVYSTYEVDGASGLAMAMKEAGNRYYEEVNDNPGHTLGLPFLHVWLALVQLLCMNVPQEMSVVGGMALRGYWNQRVTKVPRESLEEEVRYCRLKANGVPKSKKKEQGGGEASQSAQAMVSGGKARVQYALSHRALHPMEGEGASLQDALEEAIRLLGGRRLVGAPPKGPLEREVARLVEAM